METDTWIDKTAWGDGPWTNEPDRVEWRQYGFACLALRHPRQGNWCGYVAVPPGHPWHGRYDDMLDEEVRPAEIHGTLTFAAGCMEDGRPHRERICHVPRPGESDDVWWLGFDCGHGCDYQPALVAHLRSINARCESMDEYEIYRDIKYVKQNCKNLARAARDA